MKRFVLIVALVCLSSQLKAQSTITLDKAYTLIPHPRVFIDGASGAFAASNAYNSGLPAKATSSNYAWTAVGNIETVYAANPYTNPASVVYYYDGKAAANYAIECYSANTNCADALYLLNNIEKFYQMYCDETLTGENCNYAYAPTSYGPVYYYPEWMFAFELMYSQMTSGQRALFASKWLNDISAFGGIDGSPSTSCTNPTVLNAGTITSATAGTGDQTIVNTSTAMFGSGNPIQVGYWVLNGSVTDHTPAELAQVVSINSVTQAVVSETTVDGNWVGTTGPIGYRRNTWVAGDCGINWISKHEQTMSRTLSYVGGVSQYPVGGTGPGGITEVMAANNTYSETAGMMESFISLVDDDANASVRSQPQTTALWNDWYNNFFLYMAEPVWTGYTLTGGSNYGFDRPPHGVNMYTMMVNSINGTPPAIGGLWESTLLDQITYNWLPSAQTTEMFYGQNVNGPADYGTEGIAYFAPLYFVNRNTTGGAQYNWFIKNRLQVPYDSNIFYGNTPGTNLWWSNSGWFVAFAITTAHWAYAFTDPTWPSSPMTSGNPTAFALNNVDATSGQMPESALISRTGYSSNTDTLLNFYGFYERLINQNGPGGDHNSPCATTSLGPCLYPMDYRIFKGNYLLAPDGGATGNGGGYTTVGSHWWNNGGSWSGYFEIGGGYNLAGLSYDGYLPVYVTMPRSNTDGTNNRYAYAMDDCSVCYLATMNVSHIQRHVIDFKESQQFVVVFDDVATTAGNQKQTYLHYANNELASGDSTKGNTTLSGNQITSSYPGTGHSDATQLLTEVLSTSATAPAYVYTNNANGTYTGGNGDTFRVSICAATTASPSVCNTANTAANWIVVHMPVTGTSNALPAMETLATIDSDHVGVEIDGTSPKVAVFPLDGTLWTGANFTTAHSGTAQYLVTGLQAGTYDVTVGGSPVLTGATVAANDNSLYFESTSGSVVVSNTTLYYTLSTATAGTGTGTVSGSVCAGSYPAGTPVSCTATAVTGTLTSLSGCGGTVSGNVISGTMPAANCTVTATFSTTPVYTLTTSTAGLGSGTITGNPCGSGCASGTSYSLTATPASGSTFGSWSSSCGGTPSSNVYAGSMPAANCSATATFNLVVVGPASQWKGIEILGHSEIR